MAGALGADSDADVMGTGKSLPEARDSGDPGAAGSPINFFRSAATSHTP
jgi:hypothetical protein